MNALRPSLLLLASTLCLPGILSAAPVVSGPLSPAHTGNVINPLWAPDGSRLAYEVSNSQEKVTDLFLLDPASGQETRVQPPSSAGGLGGRFLERKQVNHEFSWGPKGGLYVFAGSGTDDQFDLYVKGVSIPIGSDKKEGGASFSSDGRRLVYCSAMTGEGDLYLLDLYSLEAPPSRLTFDEGGLEFYAAWSPDGKRVAYSSMAKTGANVRVIDDPTDPRGTDRPLTSWKSHQLKPSWSPDGRSIAFFSNHDRDDRTRWDLYVVPSAGGTPRKLTEGVLPNERRGPEWTPDSRSLVVAGDDKNAGDPLLVVDASGGERRILETGTVNNGEPDLSVDPITGAWRVAFVSQGRAGSETQGFRRVWIVELDAR